MSKALNGQTLAVALGLVMALLPAAARAQSPGSSQPAPPPTANPNGPTYSPPGYAPPGQGDAWAPAPTSQPSPGTPPGQTTGGAPAASPSAQPGTYDPTIGQPVNADADDKYKGGSSLSNFFSASLNLGIGVPYGVFGGAITAGMDYFALMAGAGSTIFAGFGYGIGARVYFMDTSPHYVRPHFTAVWGTTALYRISGDVDMNGTLRGFGFYAGLDQDVGEPGGLFLSYGVGYITHEGLPSKVTNVLEEHGQKEPNMGIPIKVFFAAGYRFGGQQKL
jgi:hypothetical protein